MDGLISRTLLAVGLLHLVTCYPTFRDEIPNGWNVTSPCNSAETWLGVGHLNMAGGGPRNPFGLQFKEQGYTWTETLCRADSDMDGRTNGAELGDPNCTWEKGSTPERTTGISHPGFCEPYDTPECMEVNEGLECDMMGFKCDAVTNDKDVMTYEVKLTTSPVPAKETTYMCQVVDLPTDGDYHLVAFEPFIDNINVMHHLLVYGCTDKADIGPSQTQPSECFMNRLEGCEDMIAIWSVGSMGDCYHENAGFRIGKTGYKKAMIELHWNNPMFVSTYTDGSGLKLHLTPNTRLYDAGMLMIGQTILEIPPGKMRHTENSTCSGECTRRSMSGDIYIVGALNHMHYLGAAATSQMVSEDGDVFTVSHEEHYTYNSPKFVVFDEPLLMEPGYKLQVFCHFRSTSQSDTVYYGEGTAEEMCYTFLMYYPKDNWIGEDCTSYGDYDSCGIPSGETEYCDFDSLSNQTHPKTATRNMRLYGHCDLGYCKEGCLEVVRDIFEEPCFKGQNLKLIKNSLKTEDPAYKFALMDFYYRLDSCNAELAREQCDKWVDPEVDGAVSTKMTSSVVIVVCLMTFSFM